MKKVLNLLLLALLAFSCKKDSLLESPMKQTNHKASDVAPDVLEVTEREGLNDYALTTNGVSYANGLLVFASQQVFDDVKASLTELEESESFKAAFLATKGASALDPESADYVQNPGYQAFEERFSGYVSKRRNNQDAERAFLASGGDPGDFDDGFISSPFLQTVLNTAYEIKIGDMIYREIDEHNSFVVLSGSFATLNYLRNLTNAWEANLPTDVLRLDDRVQEDESVMGGFLGGTCHGFIGHNLVGTNSFGLEFTLKSPSGGTIINYTVNWEIKNNNGQVIYTGSNSFPGTVVITGTLQNAVYPLSVTATTTSTHACDPVTVTKKIENSSPDCNFTVAFTEAPNDLGNFNFYIASQPGCCGITYNWSVDGGPVTTTNASTGFSHNAGSGEANFTLTVTMNNPAGCTATRTITINTSCGREVNASAPPFIYMAARQIRLRGWAENTWFHREFGMKLKHFRIKSDGSFVAENATSLTLVFSAGSKFTRGCQLYQDLPTSPYTRTNYHTAMRKYEYNGSDKKVRIRVGEVTATGSVVENGMSFPNIITLTL